VYFRHQPRVALVALASARGLPSQAALGLSWFKLAAVLVLVRLWMFSADRHATVTVVVLLFTAGAAVRAEAACS
jgi:hypothetical protein